MSAIARYVPNTRFKIGWILLLAAAGLMALNHFVNIFALTESTLFIGYTAFSFYSVVVLAIPFRQVEKWAWYATWILPIGLAAPVFSDPDIAADPVLSIIYLSFAAVCVLGLLLTRPEFFSKD
jgi:hypothetical protein